MVSKLTKRQRKPGRERLEGFQRNHIQHALVDDRFAPQAAFILDQSPLVGAQCTRRAGKSYGIAIKHILVAFKHPGSTSLYLALTRISAKNIMWKLLKEVNAEYGLGCRFNEADLTMRFPNGSDMVLAGADSSYQEMEKYLGGKYPLVSIDESGSFKQDMDTMVYENLMPAIADYDGQVAMIGTATRFLHTLFYKITTGEEAGWSIHKWNTFQNPYLKAYWAKQWAILKTKDPDIENKPRFQRTHMNKWVLDMSDLVYSYDDDRNRCQEMPRLPSHTRWTKIGGLDLGWDDASAFGMGSYNAHFTNKLYFSDFYKASNMTITDVEHKLKWYEQHHDISYWVVDNASKQAVEELKFRTGLHLVPAEKHGKTDFIEIMNGEWLGGTIQIVGDNPGYVTELKSLIWDKLAPGETATRKVGRGPDKVEHPKYDNHCCDVGLYVWRHCYNHLFRKVEQHTKTDEEVVDEFWEREADKITARKSSEEDGGHWEESSGSETIEQLLGLESGEDEAFFGDDY